MLSMKEIASILDTSPSTVRWWMSKHGIIRRSRSEANYRKYNKLGDPFKIKSLTSSQDYLLYGLGIGIFWGEGNKVNKHSVRVGNTDSDLLKSFIRFLKEICQVEDYKISFGLQVFNDSDPDKALRYWMEEFQVPRSRFHSTVSLIPPQGKGNYKRKSEYGVVTVYVHNIKLREWMHDQIKKCRRSSVGRATQW